tara:strand:- start:25331 stop:25630 length:300 start_codon:yes stop_codon:yes gene_type:complete
MNKIKLNYISTSSHGFIKISKYDLQAFKIEPNQFSDFSFFNQEEACFYLEEDCDANKLTALIKDKGIEIAFNESSEDELEPKYDSNFSRIKSTINYANL